VAKLFHAKTGVNFNHSVEMTREIIAAVVIRNISPTRIYEKIRMGTK